MRGPRRHAGHRPHPGHLRHRPHPADQAGGRLRGRLDRPGLVRADPWGDQLSGVRGKPGSSPRPPAAPVGRRSRDTSAAASRLGRWRHWNPGATGSAGSPAARCWPAPRCRSIRTATPPIRRCWPRSRGPRPASACRPTFSATTSGAAALSRHWPTPRPRRRGARPDRRHRRRLADVARLPSPALRGRAGARFMHSLAALAHAVPQSAQPQEDPGGRRPDRLYRRHEHRRRKRHGHPPEAAGAGPPFPHRRPRRRATCRGVRR